MFDFPSPATEGLAYNPAGGPQYVYTNGAWRMLGNPTVLATAEARNRIVNGAMQISQENGNTVGSANSYWPADQWTTGASTTGTVLKQREPASTPTAFGSRYRIVAVVTGADTSLAAGEYCITFQAIEGIRVADFLWGTASARQVILRFGCKAPAGTYAVSIINSGDSRSFVSMFTISAGEANTDVYRTIVIPGDTTGTWPSDTNTSFYIQFNWALGSTYTGGVAGWQAGPNKWSTSAISNGLGVVNNALYIFDIGLYLDPQNTGVAPAWQMPDEAEELRACQRYFRNNVIARFSGSVTSGNGYYLTTLLTPPMRTATIACTGVHVGSSSFPAAVGTIFGLTGGGSITETRTANATAGAYFDTLYTMNARM